MGCRVVADSRPTETLDMTSRRQGTKETLATGLDHLREGFAGRSEVKVPFRRMHCHDHIELGVNEAYPVVAMIGEERVVLPADHLVVFWAARPHGPIETTPGSWGHAVHIPVPWVLQWRLPGPLVRSLLMGQVILDVPENHLVSDLELVKNWVILLHQDTEDARCIVLLEVEARLLRLAIDIMARESAQHPAEPLHPSLGALGRFKKW